MKKYLSSLVSATAIVLLSSIAAPSSADTTTARCDVYPKGSDQATSSGSCSFSQWQGYITITLADGTIYELTPDPDRAATYTDPNGQTATREDSLGTEGSIYRLADVSIFVYWDSTTISSEPRRGEGNVPCSAGQPSYDRLCLASSVYGDAGNTTLTLTGPTGVEHHLSYHNHALNSTDANDEVIVQLVNGVYNVSINDIEFFQLDEIIVTGVD